MNRLIQLAIEHNGALTVAFAWLVRELHQFGPPTVEFVKQAYPWICDHGGVAGIVKTLFVGHPMPETPLDKIKPPEAKTP